MSNHRINRRAFLKSAGVALSVAGFVGCSQTLNAKSARSKQPNILFIMVDDMGKEGVGCYNAPKPSPTPNLDRMAAEGMKFNNFYVMPQCTPTRVALLTGQYPFRNGWVNHYDVPRWNLKGFNSKTNPCIGNVMKSAGYKTCLAGKWQISDFRREPTVLNECGFDDYCVWTGFESKNKKSSRRYWDAYIHTKEGSKTYEGQYGPDVFTSFICDFISQNKEQPLFVYYPMVLRHAKLEKQPDGLTEYQYIDRLVGKIEASVKEAGIAENTIILFLTDNGAEGGKGKTIEKGVCVPLIIHGPGLVGKGVETDALADVTDFMPTFAQLGGAALDDRYVYDGRSFADLITGKAMDSSRQWILGMGGGGCSRPKKGDGPFEGKNKSAYRDRVLRDKTYKVYVNTDGQIEKLVDIKSATQESEAPNLIDSKDPAAKAALQKFSAVIKQFPVKDNNPRY